MSVISCVSQDLHSGSHAYYNSDFFTSKNFMRWLCTFVTTGYQWNWPVIGNLDLVPFFEQMCHESSFPVIKNLTLFKEGSLICERQGWCSKEAISFISCIARSGPDVIKVFSCSTQLSMKIFLLMNIKMPTENSILGLFEPKKDEFLDIFILISIWNFMLSWVGKKFYNLGAWSTSSVCILAKKQFLHSIYRNV